MTEKMIPTPKMSEILFDEFMKPLHLSAYAVAKGIHVPASRIQAILHDKRKVTLDTSIRLGLFFGVSPKFFINIQNDIDYRNAKLDKAKEYSQIKRVNYA